MASTVNSAGWTVIWSTFGAVGGLALLCALFLAYRNSVVNKLHEKGTKVGLPLAFHSPDDTPRSFIQYPFKRSIVGSVLMYLWVVYFVLGFLWMMIFCWFVYPTGYSNSLGAPPDVMNAFGGWSGLVAPWLFVYTFVHMIWAMIIQLRAAIQTRFMIPVESMEEATHVMIEEEVTFLTDDDLDDPDARKSPLQRCWRQYLGAKQRFNRACCRAVLPISEDDDGTRSIEYTCVRYTYDEDERCFKPQGIREYTAREIHNANRSGGLSHEDAEDVLSTCGQNVINVHVPSILEALVIEFLDFTKVVASMGTWAYMVFSAANLGIVWFFITFLSGAYKALWITRPNQKENARLAQLHVECEVKRNDEWIKIDASEIVLGDIIRVDDFDEPKLPCDGIIIEGSVVTNESMLTGEPMPVQKLPVEDSDAAGITGKNIAYAGTKCLQSVGPASGKAVMIASAVGALTTRGQLVRMVLFPTSVRFKYIDQLPAVYGLLFIYMLLLMVIYIFFVDVGGWVASYLLVINTCAMCLNPMLPVSMVMGQTVSAKRLKNELQINCLQPGRIAIAGKISTMVFDKTGTITKEGMDFCSVVPVMNGSFSSDINFDTIDPECQENKDVVTHSVPLRLRHALASCHTVTKMRDGLLIGNAVEVSMVRTCGWDLGDPLITSPSGDDALEVVKKLDFDHHRMTSGVVVRCRRTQELEVYIKGSYEKIQQISVGVPSDYVVKTQRCAREGKYTLGVATKTLPKDLTAAQIADMTRDTLESGLTICGLLLFINEMKRDSPDAIAALKEGSIRSVICTGDNALTGISIGKLCTIVDERKPIMLGDMVAKRLIWTDPDTEKVVDIYDSDCQLAVTQAAWRHLYNDEREDLDEIWMRMVVFARMKPEDKINVVKYLQSKNLVVGMSGDGGNDCGGLRAAHAGLALSDAEASMVSPFSSGRVGELGDAKTLMTVVDMIREGRACLATNLATFQFFIVYGFTLTIIRTYLVVYASLSMGEYVWLTNDIVFGIIMVSIMVQSRPTEKLESYRPTATLLGVRTLSAIAFPVLSSVLMMMIAYALLWSQEWYEKLNPLYDIDLPGEKWMLKGDNYDSTIGAVFIFTVLSTTAFVNTYGGAFRRNIMYNVPLVVVYFITLFGIGFLTLSGPSQFTCLFRVNCDTTQSLNSGDLSIFKWFSKLGGAGLVGGCFLGPTLKDWRAQLVDYSADWLPEPETDCRPPANFTVNPGFYDMDFGCEGPNNCYSDSFKWQLAAILLIYIAMNHLFVKFVLQGPVAARLREQQLQRDARKFAPPAVHQSEDESEEGDDDAAPDETSEEEDAEGSRIIHI